MEVFDLMLDENDMDLAINNGDLDLGESTQQHQRDLLVAEPGDFKESPAIGVGILTQLLDDQQPDQMRRQITREFEKDGMKINHMNLSDKFKPEIMANYG